MDLSSLAELDQPLIDAWLAAATDDQLREMMADYFDDEIDAYDYSDAIDLIKEWARTGTVGFDCMTREQLLADIRSNVQEIKDGQEPEPAKE